MIARSPNQPLVHSVGMLVPVFSLGLASFFTSLPLAPVVGPWPLMPSLPLAVLFFWTLYRPDLLPPYIVLLAGLFHDFITGGPIGVWGFAFLVLFALTFSQRITLLARSGFEIWIGYVFYVLIGAILVWTVMSLYSAHWLNPSPFLIDAFVLSLIYPVMRALFFWSQRFVGPPV